MKYILVTGGSGYVGSHVVKMLYESGYTPVVFDKDGTTKHWSTPFSIVITGDILNISELRAAFDTYKYDAVIHLAALTTISASIADPIPYYITNVFGTANLLSVCKDYNVSKVVYSSSSSVYGNIVTLPTVETHIKAPLHAYGASKLAAEQMIIDSSVYGIKSVVLRYFNATGASPDGTIGEFRKKPSHLIPTIQSYIEGKIDSVVVNGNDYTTIDGTAVRDYTHVWDIAKAHINALKYLNNNGNTDVFNIGAGYGRSILDIISEFEIQSGKQIKIQFGPRRTGDVPINYSNNAKAEQILHWTPMISDTTNIIKTALNWYNSDLYKRVRDTI